MIHITCTSRVQLRKIIFPLLIAQIHHTILSKDHTITTIARRHHTVKHIHTPLYAFQYIPWSSYPHQITWLLRRQDFIHHFYHLIHLPGRFTNCQTTYGIAIAIQVTQIFRSILTQIFIHTSLYNGKQMLLISIQVWRAIKTSYTTL